MVKRKKSSVDEDSVTFAADENVKDDVPKSMVFRIRSSSRDMSGSVAQLVSDFRAIMNPHTAIRLKERRANALKDFVVMAGPLGVTHLCVFTQSEQANITLRIARVPRGPTLSFSIKAYSLCHDIQKTLRAPKAQSPTGPEYMQPPLLVMNGFSTEQKSDRDTLLTSMLQNMFPAIQVQGTKVSSIRRVLLINQDEATKEIEIRHYAIDTKQVNISRPIKKLAKVEKNVRKRLPNMARATDIADYLLDPAAGGYTSESEVEEDATVEMDQDLLSTRRNNKRSKNSNSGNETSQQAKQKRAIKLVEIGPRLTLELKKIEAGVCEGKVLYHSELKKSKNELKQLDRAHEERQALKLKRRKEQEENVRRKQELKKTKKSRTQRGLEKAMEKERLVKEGGREIDSEDMEDQSDLDSEKDPAEMSDYELEAADIASIGEDDEDLF